MFVNVHSLGERNGKKFGMKLNTVANAVEEISLIIKNNYIMNSKKIIGIVLILASLALGYMGVNKISNNDASVEIMDVEISASNESEKTKGFIFVGLAVIMFAGGLYTVNKK